MYARDCLHTVLREEDDDASSSRIESTSAESRSVANNARRNVSPAHVSAGSRTPRAAASSEATATKGFASPLPPRAQTARQRQSNIPTPKCRSAASPNTHAQQPDVTPCEPIGTPQRPGNGAHAMSTPVTESRASKPRQPSFEESSEFLRSLSCDTLANESRFQSPSAQATAEKRWSDRLVATNSAGAGMLSRLTLFSIVQSLAVSYSIFSLIIRYFLLMLHYWLAVCMEFHFSHRRGEHCVAADDALFASHTARQQ